MNNTAKVLLEIQKLDVAYNQNVVLKHVNMKVLDKDFIGIIGPNGGGKTTLVKAMLGLINPIKGKIINHMSSKNPIGYLPQINNIDSRFPISVTQVVLSGFMDPDKLVKRFSKNEKDITKKIMHEMGIYSLSKKPIGELSGGQLQRVFLARAIVASPELLILDEPNSFVDNTFESELYDKLKVLNEKMAIVIVSHDMGMISTSVKSIACVNTELHYHNSNVISEEQLKEYNCPIQLITHGDIPHTVLEHHNH